MSKSNVVTLASLSEGSSFKFPKGNRMYAISAIDGDLVLYTNSKGDVYDCPASHEVIEVEHDVFMKSAKQTVKSKKTSSSKRKVITAKQRENAIKGTTTVSDLKVLEARVNAIESGQTQIIASLVTQSKALEAIIAKLS